MGKLKVMMKEKMRKCYTVLVITFILVGLSGCGEQKLEVENNSADLAIITSPVVETTEEMNEETDVAKDIVDIERNNQVEADELVVKELTEEEKATKQAAYDEYDKLYEAEEGVKKGRVITDNKKEGFSGIGYVDGIKNDGDGCEFVIHVPADGFYDLNFVSASYDGYKENNIVIDNQTIGVAVVEKEEFTDSLLDKIYLTEGEHKVRLTKSWGWIYLDYLRVTSSEPIDEKIFTVSKTLINTNADDNTKRLMSYLVDTYGDYTLSGQFADLGRYSKEIYAISQASGGKIPAILGLDFIEYTPSRVERGSTSKAVEYAIEYDELGGIISLCWHWNAPSKYLTTKEPWWSGFYTKATSIDLAAIMSGKDKEGYDLLLSDIDAIAIQLQRLEDAGVPLLWRPLHEASGGWFWWGAHGSEAYKELWYLMYDRLTNYHGLNNLIWVWNGQNLDWYPGDDYVDIIGEDIYPGEKVYTSQNAKFNYAQGYTDVHKIIALTENGCLFDPDLAFRDEARWAWFGTWSGDFVINSFGGLSEQYTEAHMVEKVYNHEKVITLDELPNLKEYPMD
jgi:mannan endo-1,4-beta-mannosidase